MRSLDVSILLPCIEIAVHVVYVHMNDSALYFDVHDLFIIHGVITPLCEEAVEAFAESVADHVSGAVLELASM
jgi:hypothetical protein